MKRLNIISILFHAVTESDSFLCSHLTLSRPPLIDLNGLVKFFISTDEINLPPELELLVEFLHS